MSGTSEIADAPDSDPRQIPGGARWDEVGGLVARGLCMGTADVVPGVSGGTMALILGIYTRLVAAIRSLDLQALRLLFSGEVSAARDHVGWRFLGAIVCGQAIGVALFTRVFPLPDYLQRYPELVYGLFFGLVLGSIVTLGRDVFRPQTANAASGGLPAALGASAAGFAFGLLIVTAVPTTTPDTAGFVFLCGCISICAMILPGISGSFVLLILGKYTYVLGNLGEVIKPHGPEGRWIPFATVVVPFALGCLVGILAFSRLLTWLLARAERATLAFMTGLLAGSLYALWPFATRVYETVRGKQKLISSTPVLPSASTTAGAACALVVVGIVAVLALERLAKTRKVDARQDGE
jgi:putative membrane protein